MKKLQTTVYMDKSALDFLLKTNPRLPYLNMNVFKKEPSLTTHSCFNPVKVKLEIVVEK